MTNTSNKNEAAGEAQAQFVSMSVAGQLFGIPVRQVRDILGPQKIARIPLAPSAIAGVLNLRGRIVTAIDLRRRLGLAPADGRGMCVTVDHKTELYSLIIDKIGDVVSLSASDYESNPPTLDPHWHSVADGVYRLEDQLMIVLDVARVVQLNEKAAA